MSALLKIVALLIVGVLAGDAAADDQYSKVPSELRTLILREQRIKLMNCLSTSVELFDDRISPANVIASAVAWYCEANKQSEDYWTVLASRRSSPDTIDMFYRDLALPFVLKYRVAILWRGNRVGQ